MPGFKKALALACGVRALDALALQKSSLDDASGICTKNSVRCCPKGSDHKVGPEPAVPVKLVLASGCSGSTAVLKIAEELHKKANYHLADCVERREVLADLHKGAYTFHKPIDENHLADALKALVDANAKLGKSLMFKDQASYVLNSGMKSGDLHKYLRANGKSTMFIRRNLIDLLMCSIKDGFSSEGAGVGTCATCGNFRGRGTKEESKESLVTIKEDKIVNALFKLHNLQATKSNWVAGKSGRHLSNMLELDDDLLKEEFNSTVALEELDESVVAFEELFAFEWDKSQLDKSAVAWQRLMANVGSTFDLSMIKNHLSTLPTFSPPASHASMITNSDAVFKAIKACHDKKKYDPKWCDEIQAMWRGR